jgi:two-component system, LytTR family, sensor kinase
VEVILGVLLGWAIAASVVAGLRLIRPPRVISSEQRAMQEALHAATVTLPHLRRGLGESSATKTVGPLRTLTQALAVALVDHEQVLAYDGAGAENHGGQGLMSLVAHASRDDRLHVESRLWCDDPSCPIGAAVLAPLVVGRKRVGTFVALFGGAWRLTPEETRTVGEAASLVSAQLQLAEFEAQSERLAVAELRALRAQISPHFVYNALAAIAGNIHSDPEEARELLTEFAEFTRYAFRRRGPYVTLADELSYVEKYLRLERARFGERLDVRLQVAPEVLQAVLPMLSLQPLVENAVRHGVERRGRGRVEILVRDLDADVVLRISDDGVGMDPGQPAALLAGEGGGVGLMNVQARLQAAFGPEYGLEIESALGRGTTVTMTVPKFRAGVRAA